MMVQCIYLTVYGLNKQDFVVVVAVYTTWNQKY